MTSTEADDEIFQDALEEPALSPKNDTLDVISNNNGGISPRSLSKKFRFKKKKRVRSGEDEIPPLSETLDDAKLSVDMFLNNQFEEARAICQPMADRSMYHALGYGVFMYLKAVMTFEEKHIEEASGVLTQACDTIGQMRRKTGFTENLGRIIKKVDYDQYTEMELHAEICYSECLLLKAALTFCEDETLVSFVKAGLKVRTCYQSFRECWNALHERDWTNSEHKSDFEGGVRLGVGTFNLMISLLPARVMKVLEFIGFSGNRSSKDAGLQEIMWVEQERNGLRQFLASFILLGYHLLLSFFIGSTECNLDLCKRILEEKLAKYPEGAFFLFFKGRYHFVQGEVGEAISWYKRSVDSQNDWPQFHHICYWELYWAHVFNCDWSGGWKYSDLLLQESNWSKCIYAYQKASAMIMKGKQLDSSQNKELVELMKNVPKWKQRIAGKSLPMEKFAVRKAERFLDQSNNLMLPILELIYVWNGFHVIGKQFQLVERIYALVDSELRNLEKNSAFSNYYSENLCLLKVLQAMCLKHMKSPLHAEECLKSVISHAGKLKVDTYLVPYAMFEYGCILREQGNLEGAMHQLECAKNDFKDFSLQSRLHFRIHSVQQEIRGASEAKTNDGDPDPNHDDWTADEILPLQRNGSPSPLNEIEAMEILQGKRK